MTEAPIKQEPSPVAINPALIDAILCDRKAFLLNPEGHDFNIILTGKRPSPYSEEVSFALEILNENYCEDNAATIIIRKLLHFLASSSANVDTVSLFTTQVLEIVRMWFVVNQPSITLVPTGLNKARDQFLLQLCNYNRAIEYNIWISEEIKLILLNFWSSAQMFYFDIVNSQDLAFLAFSVISNMRYPGMGRPQLQLLAAIVDLLAFPNTPALRFMLASAILTK